MDKYNLIWMYKLAPSHELFVNIKSNKISFSEYVKTYRKEMFNMQNILNRIEEKLLLGENFAFICYCPDKNKCHRNILGNYFAEIGFDIIEIK